MANPFGYMGGSPPSQKKLRKDAVPSVFSWSKPESVSQQKRNERLVRRSLYSVGLSTKSSTTRFLDDSEVEMTEVIIENGPMSGMMMPMAPPPPPPNGVDPGNRMNSRVNPAMNNEPLQFNMNKGKPPMAVSNHEKPRKHQSNRDEHSDNRNMGDMDLANQCDDMMFGGGADMMQQDANMMGGGWGMMGPPNMMMGDPMMMGGPGMGGWGGPAMPMGMGMDMMPPREPIVFSSCTLYPPPPTAPPPTTRERPPGCRTVFVGGLPENVTEEIVKEVFANCGGITSVRVSKKKNFCHIRFMEEFSVDKALQISGYRMKLGNKDDKPNTGRIHVDFAQARDDLYEWECQQRALAREMRHRQRVEQDRIRPPSPPPVIHYSDHEAHVLSEKIKSDDTFVNSSEILITWLDRGDCNRKSSNQFYSMIQSVNSHIRRLTNEKAVYNEEFEQMKLNFRQRLEGLLRQFEQIDKVFKAATRQKAWDHFSKAQRKNIDTWKAQCQEIQSREQQEFLRERTEDEMEMSDNEEASLGGEPSAKKKRNNFDDSQLANLREENDNLRCQLEAYRNEVMLLKEESKTPSVDEEKDKQIRILQQTLQGMQQQLLSAKKERTEKEESLRSKLETQQYEMDRLQKTNTETLKKLETVKAQVKKENASVEKKEEAGEEKAEEATAPEEPSSSGHTFTDREARLVGLISTFLHVHPFGASIDYIASYLARLQMKVRTSELEDVLENCPSVFKLEVCGVGASIEKRWKFIGFNPF